MNTTIENTKSMALMAQVARGLLAHGSRATVTHLGDRSGYIGMSDIGKATECLRAAVAGKVKGSQHPDAATVARWFEDGKFGEIQSVLERQLILQRGHWFEEGITQAFIANGARLFSQLEIEAEIEGVPVKAHLDMALLWGNPKPTIRVLEIKSTERLPDTLYAGYETQLYGQLGMLAQFWNQPSFSLRDSSGQILQRNLSLPELAKRQMGIDLPADPSQVDVEGWVLTLSMSGAKPFGPYVPDVVMLSHCLKTATAVWQQAEAVRSGIVDLDQIDYCRGFHPLCDCCSHQDGCPKFACQHLGDSSYDQLFVELEAMKRQKAEAEAGISDREKQLKAFYWKSKADTWLASNGWKFKCQEITGRKSLDTVALVANIAEALGDEAASQMVESCTKPGSPYQRLFVSKSKGPIQEVV